MKGNLVAAILLLAAGRLAAAGQEIRVSTAATGPGQPLVHYWSVCVGAGCANEGRRANWREQLKLAHDACGFPYPRQRGRRLGGDGRARAAAAGGGSSSLAPSNRGASC